MKMSDYLKNIEDNNVSYWLYVRENLKPNDYVKLNTGEITRSINVSPIKGNRIYYANGDDCWFDISAVRNFSLNIIDLIEVGDVVKFDIFTSLETNNHLIGYTNIDSKEMIKEIKNDKSYKVLSIITHEQIESMEYKVGE